MEERYMFGDSFNCANTFQLQGFCPNTKISYQNYFSFVWRNNYSRYIF